MSKKLTLNVELDDLRAIANLIAYYQPFLKSHAVAVVALRLGLAALEEEPARLPALLANPNQSRREAQG